MRILCTLLLSLHSTDALRFGAHEPSLQRARDRRRGLEQGVATDDLHKIVLALRAGADGKPLKTADSFAAKWSQRVVPMLAAFMSELKAYGLLYLVWLYCVAFGAYSLRVYCISCPITAIKSAIPAIFFMHVLWRISDMWVTTNEADGSVAVALAALKKGLFALNVVSTMLVLIDMGLCFRKLLAALS